MASPLLQAASKADARAAMGPTDDWVAAGDAWYLVGEDAATEARLRQEGLARALFWYARAYPKLAEGLDKLKVEKRLKQHGHAVPQPETAATWSPSGEPKPGNTAQLTELPTAAEIEELIRLNRAPYRSSTEDYQKRYDLRASVIGRLSANPEKWTDEDFRKRYEILRPSNSVYYDVENVDGQVRLAIDAFFARHSEQFGNSKAKWEFLKGLTQVNVSPSMINKMLQELQNDIHK
jgi:hypothetical protein